MKDGCHCTCFGTGMWVRRVVEIGRCVSRMAWALSRLSKAGTKKSRKTRGRWKEQQAAITGRRYKSGRRQCLCCIVQALLKRKISMCG